MFLHIVEYFFKFEWYDSMATLVSRPTWGILLASTHHSWFVLQLSLVYLVNAADQGLILVVFSNLSKAQSIGSSLTPHLCPYMISPNVYKKIGTFHNGGDFLYGILHPNLPNKPKAKRNFNLWLDKVAHVINNTNVFNIWSPRIIVQWREINNIINIINDSDNDTDNDTNSSVLISTWALSIIIDLGDNSL